MSVVAESGLVVDIATDMTRDGVEFAANVDSLSICEL
jgi:hypothetical protein